MSRTAGPSNAHARTLWIVLSVTCAGFAMAGTAGIIVLLATGYRDAAGLLALGAFALASLISIAAVGGAYWLTVTPPAHPEAADPRGEAHTPTHGPSLYAPRHLEGDAVELWEGSFEAQRQLLDDVRHELKTPITIVRGHLELMNTQDPADVEAVRSIGIAELDRMTRLVNDIDLLAAVQGDSFSFGVIDLAELTQRVGELVAVIPGHSWKIEQIAQGRVRGDHDRLVQAWLQLADNAAKYTPAGTSIEIGTAVHSAGAQLWVRDHGPGIPPAARHRIFRRFDRADGKRSVGGSGLGLAIVDTIARGHGGHCAVTDTPGGGATFTIEVPIGTGIAIPSPVRAGDVVQQRENIG